MRKARRRGRSSRLAQPWTWLGPHLCWVLLGGSIRPGLSSGPSLLTPLISHMCVQRLLLGNSARSSYHLTLGSWLPSAQPICMQSPLEILGQKPCGLFLSFFSLAFSLFNVFHICAHTIQFIKFFFFRNTLKWDFFEVCLPLWLPRPL